MKFLLVSLGLLAVVAADVAHLSTSYPLSKILRQTQDISPNGSYRYAYETQDGTVVDEAGQPGPVGPEGAALVVRGNYKFVANDGVTYEVNYTADETGFHPEGAHIPLVPEVIQRSLKYNEAHPEVHPTQYSAGSQREVNIRPKPFRH